MQCPKCSSTNVNVQVVTETKLKNKHHNILWWFFVGWYWVPFKWLVLTLPALIFKIFGHKKQKVKQKNKQVCVCQSCGNTWEIK